MKTLLEIVSETKNVKTYNLGLLARAITHSKIENPKLIQGVIKSASFSNIAFSLKFYPFMKSLRYIAGVRYPTLNYDPFDIRCYHSEQILNPMATVTDEHRE